MSKAVGVLVDGVVEWHAPRVAGPDYDTLCGIDAHDPEVGHQGLVPTKRGQKINCPECKRVWEGVLALRLRKSSFRMISCEPTVTLEAFDA